MKKILLGGILIVSGTISFGFLCSGAMASDIFINGSRELWKILNYYGVTTYAVASLMEICIGVVFSIIGLIAKDTK